MTRGSLSVLLFAASCDFAFRLDHVPPYEAAEDADVPADLAGDTPTDELCTETSVDDDFTGTMPCVGWGTLYDNGTTVISGTGQLTITPNKDGSTGECESDFYPFATGGVITHVTSTIGGAASFTGLMTNLNASIQVNQGSILFETNDSGTRWFMTGYDPIEMAWFRLWPDRANSELVASTSPDGAHWNELSRIGMPLPSAFTASLVGGVDTGYAYSGSAAFERFVICK